MFSKDCIQVRTDKIKVLIGSAVSFPRLQRIHPRQKGLKEQFEYLEVKTIKASKDSDFCILTLKKEYDGPASPLCLPELNNNHYEKIPEAKFYGFSYPDSIENTVKSWLDEKPNRKFVERKITKYPVSNIKTSSKCAKEYRTWALERGSRGYPDIGEYFWLEKYVELQHIAQLEL